jgi:hypothetical protein
MIKDESGLTVLAVHVALGAGFGMRVCEGNEGQRKTEREAATDRTMTLIFGWEGLTTFAVDRFEQASIVVIADIVVGTRPIRRL